MAFLRQESFINSRQQKAALRIAKPHKVNQAVRLFDYTQDTTKWETWHGRTITLRTAETMVAAGEAERLTRRSGDEIIIVYKASQPTQPSQPTACTLTMGTMSAVAANQPGAKLTRGELAHVAKFVMWPLEHDRRNKATVVAGTHADRIRAEKFLAGIQNPRHKAREGNTKPRTMTAFYEMKPVAA